MTGVQTCALPISKSSLRLDEQIIWEEMIADLARFEQRHVRTALEALSRIRKGQCKGGHLLIQEYREKGEKIDDRFSHGHDAGVSLTNSFLPREEADSSNE